MYWDIKFLHFERLHDKYHLHFKVYWMVQNEVERWVSVPSPLHSFDCSVYSSHYSFITGWEGYFVTFVCQAYHQIRRTQISSLILLVHLWRWQLLEWGSRPWWHNPIPSLANRSHPSQGLYANTISTTAGRLTNTSLTQSYMLTSLASSNVGLLTNTSLTELHANSISSVAKTTGPQCSLLKI